MTSLRSNAATTSAFTLRVPGLKDPWIVLAASLAVLIMLWTVTGLDMYPLDDGWVMFSSKSLSLQWGDFFLGNSRELRVVPYLVSRALEDDGFRVANLILIGLDLAIFVGLFAVFDRLLEGRSIAAFTAAGLAMLFPGDPTMFWLGAYGVNISYALLLWSTWFSLVAIDRGRWGYQLAGLALLYCGIRTYPGYIFLPLVLVCFRVFVQAERGTFLRGLLRHCVPQLLVLALALAPTLIGMLGGAGREAHVASFDASLALAGYQSMLAHLTAGWLAGLTAFTTFPLSYAVAFAVVFSLAMAVLAVNMRRTSGATSDRTTIALIVAAVAVVLLCYLPYAISDVRFGTGRTLIGSRAGFFLLLVAVVDGLWLRMRRPGWLAIALVGVAVALLLASSMAQRSLFQERYRQSLFQRVFLADLAATLHCPPSTPVLIVTAPKTLGRYTGGSMLINRVQFPVRTLYGTRDVHIASANNYMLVRSGRVAPDGTLVYRGLRVGSSPLLLRYTFRGGFKREDAVPVQVGHERQPLVLHGSGMPAQQCDETPLMRALLIQYEQNRQRLGLPIRSAGPPPR
jgi:hypothetical protein